MAEREPVTVGADNPTREHLIDVAPRRSGNTGEEIRAHAPPNDGCGVECYAG